jgi:hypothetical protein
VAINVDTLVDWDEFADEAETLLRKYYPQLLELAYGDAGDLLGGDSIRWEASNPRIKDVIDTLAKKIRNVAETTREDVRRWVEIGTEEGLSVTEIARQIRSNSANISPSRALTIARTESGTAYNRGALLAYEDGGVTRVEVLDGDEDEACAAANGQIWTLEEAAAEPIAHPNCTRAYAPVVGRD